MREAPDAPISAPQHLVAVLDANVLYSASLRHLLIHVAIAGAFRAHWTHAIQDEWTRSLLRDRPDIDPTRIARTRQLMDEHVDGALVRGHESLIATLSLPDPDDRHVLAAAIHCGASVIVSLNRADFPAAALEPHGLELMTPDDFLAVLLEASPQAVIEGARLHRSDLKAPPRSPKEYVDRLASNGLVNSADTLRQYLDRL